MAIHISESFIHGHHIFNNVWTPLLEELTWRAKTTNNDTMLLEFNLFGGTLGAESLPQKLPLLFPKAKSSDSLKQNNRDSCDTLES